MRIRPAAAEDAPALAAIAAAAYRAAFLPIIGEAGLAQRREGFFRDRFAAEWPSLHVVAEESRLRGFLQLRGGRIDMLFLDSAATGRGFGAALLADAERRGARELECFRDNAGARRFYERAGWRLVESYERDFAGGRHPFVLYRKG